MLSLPPPNAAPWTIAHRGASADFPENTLMAFRAAGAITGVDAVELDVQRTSDGVVVAFHDETPARMGGGDDPIDTLSYDALQRVDVGAPFGERFRGTRIPTLTEVLHALPDTRLCIEIKVYPGGAERGMPEVLAADVAACVREAAAADRVLVMSFDHRCLAAVTARAPELTRVGLFERVPAGPEAMAPFQGVNIGMDQIDAAFVGMARDCRLPILVYTCNTDAAVAAARRWGVQGITTDRPGWLVDQRRIGAW